MRRSLALAVVLAACGRQPPEVVDEVTRRTAYVRALSEREGHVDAWSLTSRADVSFEDGMSSPTFIDEHGDAIRWIDRRAHLRVRGATDMVLELRGKILSKKAGTPPRLEISVDGERVESTLVDADGSFATRTVVKRETTGDWRDVYATFSGLQESDVARLSWVGWEPVSP